MKNKLVKILSFVSIVCLLVSCFAFSSSASEDLDYKPSYYTTSLGRNGMAYWYYIDESLVGIDTSVALEFVSNGVKFTRITSSDGDIVYSNSEISLKICTDGSFLDNGSWRYIFAYTTSGNAAFVNRYCSLESSPENWSSMLEYTFVNFNTFKNSTYLSTLFDYIGASFYTFGCNVRLDFNGYIQAKAYNKVILTGSRYPDQPSCFIFQNTNNGDSLVLPMGSDVHNANWSNLTLYAQPSDYTGYDFINLLSLISDVSLGDFYYSFSADPLSWEWEYYDYCDLNYNSLFNVFSDRFYSAYGLPTDVSGLKLDSNLGITSNGVVKTDNYPNSSSEPPYDNITILPYSSEPLVVSSTFYWLCDHLIDFSDEYNDRSRFIGDSYTFISTTVPDEVSMLYNSFGIYRGYCGFVINGVLFKYFEYSRYEDIFRFYLDVNSDTGEPEIPDYVVSREDFVLHSLVIPSGEFIGIGFYQFCVENFDVVGQDITIDIQQAYIDGKNAGYAEGKAYAESKYGEYEQIGYNKGFAAARDLYDKDSGGIIGKLLSAPGDAFEHLVIYEEGSIIISIWDVFTTLICVSLFIWFLKMFAGG